jgi:hypothetical protein
VLLCCLAAGEFYEVKCHEGAVARLRVSYDDFLLVSAGEDGSVVMLDIRDKELAKASSRQQQVRQPGWQAVRIVRITAKLTACRGSRWGATAECCAVLYLRRRCKQQIVVCVGAAAI